MVKIKKAISAFVTIAMMCSMFMAVPMNVSALDTGVELVVNPGVLMPAKLNSGLASDRTITVDVKTGTRPWLDTDTTLSVEVTRDGDTYSIIPENMSQSGAEITVVLPQTDVFANPGDDKSGAFTVSVKRDTTVLGTGSLKVTEITGIEMKEDSNRINITGTGIVCFQSPGLYAEIYDGVNKLDTSTQVNYFGSQTIEFEFDKNLSLNVTYTLKLFDGTEDKSTYLPNNGNFTVIPILACSFNGGAPIVSGDANQTLAAADKNNLWAAGDSLYVMFCGPDVGGEINVTAAEDDVSFSTGSTPESPWQNGQYEARILDGTHKILGIAQFYVGNPGDVLQGEVRDSAGALQPSCGSADLIKLEDGGGVSWKGQAFVLPDGKFYIYKDRIPVDQSNNGIYRASIFAPDNLTEADAVADFSISNGVISPNPVVLQFRTPNVTGTVNMPDGVTPAANVPVSVLGDDNKTKLFQAFSKSDGTFNIKIAAGSYYLQAMPVGSMNAVASKSIPVTVPDTGSLSVNLQLQPPQITITAKDPSNNPLDTSKFRIKIMPVDKMSLDSSFTCRQNDYLVGNLAQGQYMVSAVPDGGCEYTQSYAQIVTVSDTGVATPGILDLSLTNAKLTGTVAGMTSMDGHVVLYKKDIKGFMRLSDSSVSDDGSYKIGAVDNGDYFIRAELSDFSSLKANFGSSPMTPVTISDTPSTKDLTLGNTLPRLVYVNGVQKGAGNIKARVINVKNITKNPVENNSLRAEVVNLDGSSLSPKVEITGADNFMIHWEYFDQGNNEGDIDINVPGGINLPIGKYKLKLFDIRNPADTGDDLLFDSDLSYSSEFDITSGIYLMPIGFFPSKAGQKTTVEAFDQPQPWGAGDTLDVVFIGDNGVSTPAAGVTILPDNRLDIILPALTEGKYLMTISKGGKLVAQQGISVGTPQVNLIQFASDEDRGILLEGEYLEALADDNTTVKIYSGTTLITTTQKVWNSWGNLAVDFDNPLPVGDYTVKMWSGAEINENLITLPNGGALKIVNQLKSSKPFVLSGYANNTTLTMAVKQGSTPWADNQDLTLVLSNGKEKPENSKIISLSDDAAVSGVDFTFALPDDSKLMDGKWSVEVKSGDILIAKGYFDVVNSSDISFSGTVSGSGGSIAGARVNVERVDKKEFYTFYTEGDGNYKAYWISSPGTYNVWVEPNKADPYMELSKPRQLTIDETGHCTSPTQNFTLADAGFINGTISLPSGTAGSDIRFWVDGFCLNGTPADKSDDAVANAGGIIAAGASSGNYTLKVPKAVTGGYYVQVFADTNDYISNYYYSDSGPKYNMNEATAIDISSGSQSGKDITLDAGTTIAGSITIPAEIAIPAEGYGIALAAIMDNGTADDKGDDWVINSKVGLTSSTQAYTLHVPANPSGKPYKVAYDADPKDMLELQGFYKSSGTVYDGGATADPVDVSSANATGINLTARIRTDVETRAGFIEAMVNAVGAEKFIQPSADEISSYEAAYSDWSSMTDVQKSATAIAVKNGIIKGTSESTMSPGGFVSRAAVMLLLNRTSNVLGAGLVEIQPDKNFYDISNHWGEDAILKMARAGVVNGYEDGNFDPDGFFMQKQTLGLLSNYTSKLSGANATRAGLIANAIYGLGKDRFLLPTEAEVTEYSTNYIDWNDIPSSMEKAMAIAIKNNIVSGTADGMLQPNGKITRAEVSVVLCRIVDNADPVLVFKDLRGLPSFTDVSSGHWAKSSIDKLYKANIINGITSSTFGPDKLFAYASIQPMLNNLYSGINAPKAVISTQPENQTVTYGDASVTLSVSATGDNISYQWKKGGVVIDGATSATYTINNPTPADGGSYSVEIKTGIIPFVTSVNSTAAILTVNPKDLTVTGLAAENKTYDGTTAATISGIAALSGIVGIDDVSLTGTPTAVFSDKNAADNKTVTVTGYTLSGADAVKYKLVQPTLTSNIAKAALTATADDKQRAFGVSNPALTITYSGFVNGETKTTAGITEPVAACTAASSTGGGAYPITLTGGSGGTNYSLSLVNGTLVIIPGLPNVTFSFDGADANKLKGSTTAMEYSLDGGTTWNDCTVDTDLTGSIGSIAADKDIKVREKAVTGPPAVPAGVILTLDILPAPLAPSTLKLDYTTEKISGATAMMEYKTDSGAYQTVTASEATSGIDLSSVIPADGSPAKVMTIGIKAKGLTLKGAGQTINIPARPATPAMPSVAGKAPTSITLAAIAGLEYTKNDGATWQSSAAFTGLTTGTAYSFKSRVKATTSAFASDKSTALDVTYYTITFVPNGGSPAPSVQAVISGTAAEVPGAMTKTGYTGGNWYALEDLSGSPYNFADTVNGNITLYAKWTIDKYNVTAAVTGGVGGSISPAAKQVAYGDNLTVTILPNTGYELTGFTVDGTDKLSGVTAGKYLITDITANTAIAATFSKKKYEVTVNAGAGGSVTTDATDGKVEYGSPLTVTVTPADGKNTGSVDYTMGGVTVNPVWDNPNHFTVSSVTGPVTIRAAFADVDKSALKTAIAEALLKNPDAYIDSVRTAFKNALAAAITVMQKTAASADEVTAAATALTNATAALTEGNKKAFTVTVDVPEPTHGSADASSTNPKYGTDVTITTVPTGGYELYKILVNGIQLNGNIIKNVTANTTVTVLFKSSIPLAVTTFKSDYNDVLTLTINTVTDINSDRINTAIVAFNGLGENQKYLAVEYQRLKALRIHLDNKTKAAAVQTAIGNLFSVARNLTFIQSVNGVIAQYNSLTPDQQKLVGIDKVNELNKYKLEADVIFKKDLADAAKKSQVQGLIDGLLATIGGGGYVNVLSATIAYNTAKSAYDTLTVDLRTQITTTQLVALKNQIDAANQAAAVIVQDQINALTKVDSTMAFDVAEGHKKTIIEAKNAYDALTAAQKVFISSAAKTKLDECFESVAIKIEKPVEGLDTSVSFTGISDKVSDMAVIPADASKEATVNQILNTDGAQTAQTTDMVISITLKNSSDQVVQPDGKVKMKIKIKAELKNRKPKVMFLDDTDGLYEVPSWITGNDTDGWYIEFETDHFSDYAVVSAVLNNNANLSELTLEGVTLSPVFNKNTTSYTASVANSVSTTVVNPVVEDTGKATVTGSGTWNLSTGANTKNIIVTAEDGTAKTYTITVTRAAASSDQGQNNSSGSTTGTPAISTDGTTNQDTADEQTVTDNASEPTVSDIGNEAVASITTKAKVDEKTGTANAGIDAKTVDNLTDLVKKTEGQGKKSVVEIKVEASDKVNAVSVEIPGEAFNKIANETKADVKVSAGLGTITFNSKAVKQISGADTGNLSISISKVEVSTLSAEVQSKVGERPVFDFSIKAGSTEISKFGEGTAEVSIPYTLKTGEKKNSVIVYYIDNEGKLITVRGRYDDAAGTVNFKTNHFSRFAVGYNEVKFNDVADSAWYNEAVGFIAARGITTGTGDGYYNPDSNLTRGQYIVMMMRAYGIDPIDNPQDNFADGGSCYYTGYLAAAKKLGISSGIGNNMYAPDKEITRQEMFTLLYNTLKAIDELPEGKTGKPLTSFIDSDKIAAWAKDAMALFTETGTISGSNDKLSPTDTSNRAQMAQVIYNLLVK